MTSVHSTHFTPYEEVNTLLAILLTRVQTILADQLVAFYLYGSLSLGDFDPASSDVDFLIITAQDLSEEILAQLRVMHTDIASSGLPYATHLEGSYIPRQAIRRYDPANDYHPTIGVDWPFKIDRHDSSWIIERSFVQHMADVEADVTIVSSTVAMAHSLGLKVVAEGVEDQVTWHILANLKCDTAQGYYMSRPLPAHDLEKWVRQTGQIFSY